MADSVSFKAYLKRDGQEVEVRRFGIDGGAATNYMYLRSKIQAVFPSIEGDQVQIYWQDNDQDYIRVDSDEELLEALTSSNQQPLKLYIQVQKNIPQDGAPGAEAGPSDRQHPGVTCDGCDGSVVGFRYKCVTCPDFDLCSRCENNGLHPEHFMLRISTPMNSFLHHPKFIRKLFSHPHKFHKRHGWGRTVPPMRGCGDSQNGAGRCPFSRRGEGPTGPAGAFAGVTDMFDFSALMEFIESLGVAGDKRATQNPQSQSTEAPNSASQNSTHTQEPQRPQNERPGSTPAPERRGSAPATEYLNHIGQMVASILDPLGVDVTFDVRTKQSQPQAPTTASEQVPTQAPTAPTPVPTAPIQAPTQAPTTPTPVPAVPATSSQTETTPAATTETQTEPVRERCNFDDWTLICRESPTRNSATAMEVDGIQGAIPKTRPPFMAQATPSPSAPPQADDLSDAERKRIQDAIDTFQAMGFNFNPDNLREMLKKQNCNITSVLETMLSTEKK